MPSPRWAPHTVPRRRHVPVGLRRAVVLQPPRRHLHGPARRVGGQRHRGPADRGARRCAGGPLRRHPHRRGGTATGRHVRPRRTLPRARCLALYLGDTTGSVTLATFVLVGVWSIFAWA